MDDEHGWSWLFGKFYAIVWRNPKSNRVVVEAAEPQPGEQVLDIGCGAGKALVVAADIVGEENCFGVDPTPALAETARRRLPGGHIEVAVAEDLPFADDSFDAVWTISSPHHWDDRDQGIEEAARVLRPGGRFLLAEQRKRKEGGHGLTDSEAAATARELEEVGLERVEILHRPIKWYAMLIVRGWRPS